MLGSPSMIGAALDLGRIGLWSVLFRTLDRAAATDAIAHLEALEYETLWIPESGTKIILDVVADLLAASEKIRIASGILNIWMHEPEDVATAVQAFRESYPERFLLGLGVSHASLVEPATGRDYTRPRSMMVGFLDGLDAATPPVTSNERILAALGPRMLELAKTRSLGAHPYCIPVEGTAVARAALGAGPLVASELKAVLVEDATLARSLAREHLSHYLDMPNYVNNLSRFGFNDEDFTDGGSNRLVDALVAWGTPEQVAARVNEHHAAGADHVCVNVIPEDATKFPLEEWGLLAAAVKG